MTQTIPPSARRAILRATAIVGGASVMNILIGLIRNKVAALLLGPAGIGAIGLLLNLVTTLSSLVGLGIAMAGVRALASAGDDAALLGVRQAIGRLTIVLAITGTGATWLLRDAIARYALGNVASGGQVGWLAPAVGLTIWSSMQFGLLNGLRRLGDFARAQVGGAALASVLGIAALLLWGERGITFHVVSASLGMVMIGFVYTARLRGGTRPSLSSMLSWRDAGSADRDLIRLGVPMMLGGLALPLGLLLIRAVLGDRLGAVALGQFTAAWTLSATYVGFVLAAMGTDYFPRLSAKIGDPAEARQMVGEQSEVALLLALPIMLGVQAAVPWLIRLLYSDAFLPAVSILHWQIAGDILKLASWPLTFVVLAQGRGKLYWTFESLLMTAMVVSVWALIHPLGLVATGVAYFLAYALYLPVLLVAARHMIGLRWPPRVAIIAGLGLIGVVAIALLDQISDVAALALGFVLAAISAGYSFVRLR